MTASTNFFTTAINEATRNSAGWPLLIPDGMPADSPVRAAYSRASGLADYLTDNSFLHQWKTRYLVRAMGTYTDLQELAASETYHTGLEPLDVAEKRQSGKRLDAIAERALDRMKIHEKADYGTAFHALTEPGNTGAVSERMKPDVDSFTEMCRALAMVIVGTEAFTANDLTMTAGTFDHLVRFPGEPQLPGLLIGDKKTGRVDPLHWAVQLATYANGKPYDLDRHVRTPWPDEPLNLQWGVMLHTPALSGKTTVYLVDIHEGWRLALLASAVRDARDLTNLLADYKPTPLLERAENCAGDIEGLRALWYAAEYDSERNYIESMVAAT